MTQDKAIAKLGKDTVEEMDVMGDSELKKVIFDATSAMDTVRKELAANKDYQELKRKLSAMEQGKKDVDSRQKARISYGLELLDRFGKMSPAQLDDWMASLPGKLKELQAKKEAAARKAAETAPSAVRHLKAAGKDL